MNSEFKVVSILITLSICLAFTPFACGQETTTKLPDNAVGHVFKSWLNNMNATKEATDDAFNPSAFRDKSKASKERRDELRDMFRQRFGVLKATKVVEQKDRMLSVVLSGRDKTNLLVTVFLTPAPDDLIEAVKIEPYHGAAPSQDMPKLSKQQFQERIAAILEKEFKDGFSGAVLISRNDETLFANAYGLANRSYKVSNNIDTKFNLGSMNKMFTAVAIMQLAEHKKLTVSDPISKFLDETWLPTPIAKGITIEHLLTHTSGLGSYFNEEFQNGARSRYRDVADFKPLVVGETLAFEPGSRWQYSNTGFLLLGAIVEEASGQNYFDYIRTHVYAESAMTNSDCFEMDTPTENLAYGYWKDGDQWRNNLFMHVIKGGPAGGGFSTVKDLSQFSEALTDFKLLSREGTRELFTPKPKSPRYGYGFEINQTPSGLVVGHGGGFPGIESRLAIFLDKQVTVVVLCNAQGSMDRVIDKISESVSLWTPGN